MFPAAEDEIQLIAASQFSLEQLTAIYNQSRVDYIIPMPMSAARLQEYIDSYDVSLPHSLVAVAASGEMLGVAMLGVRKNRAWLTRLGVLPATRRHGAGRALMLGLLNQANSLGLRFAMLEVIKNNTPAHQLFLKLGFQEQGELLILRRSPTIPPPTPLIADAERLERLDALSLLSRADGLRPWTNQPETLFNAPDVAGLHVTLPDGSRGWLVYQRQKFTLSRFFFQTEAGDPALVARAFLSHLHYQYPRLDTHIENIRASDPHLPAFYEMGYLEAFRRIEMWRGEPPPSLRSQKGSA